jgi:hypothetical protein
MFIQTQPTPNPQSLMFLPGREVMEVWQQQQQQQWHMSVSNAATGTWLLQVLVQSHAMPAGVQGPVNAPLPGSDAGSIAYKQLGLLASGSMLWRVHPLAEFCSPRNMSLWLQCICFAGSVYSAAYHNCGIAQRLLCINAAPPWRVI